MSEEFKLPKLTALDNGQLELIPGHEGGWVVTKPEGLTQVWEHSASGSELAIICARLEIGERVLVVLSLAAEDVILVEECLEGNGISKDAEMDVYLQAAVNRALEILTTKFE